MDRFAARAAGPARTQAICAYHFDLGKKPWLDMLYEAPSEEDGYFRDACVFREEIDIPDTMSAAILYENGVQVSYSLNTFMPKEGYHLAFNGHRGRIEVRHRERDPFDAPGHDEVFLMRNFGTAERLDVAHEPGGHFGGDPALQRMLFGPSADDPLGQRAGPRAGAVSVLAGSRRWRAWRPEGPSRSVRCLTRWGRAPERSARLRETVPVQWFDLSNHFTICHSCRVTASRALQNVCTGPEPFPNQSVGGEFRWIVGTSQRRRSAPRGA